MIFKQFIYISILSVFGLICEKDYLFISEEDILVLNMVYGLSKLKVEFYIQSIFGFLYVIYCLMGVYGFWEVDYFLMVKFIWQYMDFFVGYKW